MNVVLRETLRSPLHGLTGFGRVGLLYVAVASPWWRKNLRGGLRGRGL